jgi:hypothetical protein
VALKPCPAAEPEPTKEELVATGEAVMRAITFEQPPLVACRDDVPPVVALADEADPAARAFYTRALKVLSASSAPTP